MLIRVGRPTFHLSTLIQSSGCYSILEILSKIVIMIKLYCHIQRALHDELECSLALTHIVPKYIYIYTIKLNMANKYKIHI